MQFTWISLTASTCFLVSATAVPFPRDSAGGSDLAYYVSRPDIRAPWFNVTTYDADEVTQGYWFTAPYAELKAGDLSPEYLPYQSGPHIYDHHGELVWSGGPWAEHSNTFDFRMAGVNGSKVLSGILGASRRDNANNAIGFILNDNYGVIEEVDMSESYNRHFNQHEFNVIENDRILIATAPWIFTDLVDIGDFTHGCTVVADGFREYDLKEKTNVFEWNPINHISLNESFVGPPPRYLYEWDAFHLNSVAKDIDGNFMISMRHTNTVYKISRIDGSVIWRLGGKHSDFEQDFNFSSQHHARILFQDASTTIISLFDNSADDQSRQPTTASASTVKIIRIYDHTHPLRAELLTQYTRPDGGLTNRRGSAQILPSNHAFISWSENGYISEHTLDGRVVLEARFAGDRFSTYRAYHSADWVGRPLELPSLVTMVYGGSNTTSASTTILYVSWNGATEARRWRFFGARNHSAENGPDVFEELGSVAKVSFESSIAVPGIWRYTYAEAEDEHGEMIARSDAVVAILGNGWEEEDLEEMELLAQQAEAELRRMTWWRHGTARLLVTLCVVYTVGSLLMGGWRRWRRGLGRRRTSTFWKQRDETLFRDQDIISLNSSNTSSRTSRRNSASPAGGAEHAGFGYGSGVVDVWSEKQLKTS